MRAIFILITLACLNATAAQAQPAPAAPESLDPLSARQSLDSYIDRLKQKILRNWNPPKQSKQTNTAITFLVSKDGTISDLKVVNSSGQDDTDMQALAAIYKLSPVDPLPPFSPPSVRVDMSFEFTSPQTTTSAPDND